MADSQLERAARQFRADLEQQIVTPAQRQLVALWGQVWARIEQQLLDLTTAMKQAQRDGQSITPGWVFQQRRFEALQRQTAEQIAIFRTAAQQLVADTEQHAIALALAHADQLGLLASAGSPSGVFSTWEQLPAGAVRDLVAVLHGPGSPVGQLLAGFGADAAARVRAQLVHGLATGRSSAQTARAIRDDIAGDAVRAVTIVRTETQRAYREATRAVYAENSGVVHGWIWRSARSTRTCAACWAMDGTVHTLDETLDGHPRCRCFMVPCLLPVDEMRRTLDEAGDTGPQVFARLAPAQQRQILGPAKYNAYRDGRLGLQHLVVRASSDRWGSMRREATLREALVSAARAPAEPVLRRRVVDPSTTVANMDPVGHPAQDAVRREARDVLELIGRLHGVPDTARPISFRADPNLGLTGEWGRTVFNRAAGPRTLSVWTNGPSRPFTFAHEFGHYVDWEVLPGDMFSSGSAPQLAEWRNAVDRSRNVADLRALAASPGLHPKVQTYVSSYLLDWSELWARSYSQWVAERSGDRALLDGVAAAVSGRIPDQWSAEDFAPIGRAIDGLFRAVGLLR